MASKSTKVNVALAKDDCVITERRRQPLVKPKTSIFSHSSIPTKAEGLERQNQKCASEIIKSSPSLKEDILQYHFKGTNYSIVGELKHYLEDLKCSICLEISDDPVQTSCGHLFCGKCLEEGGNEECPICRKSYTPTKDARTKRIISNLTVMCSREEKGCTWRGPLIEAESHWRDCNYEIVTCSNRNCKKRVIRKNLKAHLEKTCDYRPSKCSHCGMQDKYMYIVTSHYQDCQWFPESCPNGCGKVDIPRCKMNAHMKTCDQERINCKYKSLGCTTKMERSKQGDHLQAGKERHLELAMDKLSDMAVKLDKCSEECALLKERLAASEADKETLKQRVTALEGRLEQKQTDSEFKDRTATEEREFKREY